MNLECVSKIKRVFKAAIFNQCLEYCLLLIVIQFFSIIDNYIIHTHLHIPYGGAGVASGAKSVASGAKSVASAHFLLHLDVLIKIIV